MLLSRITQLGFNGLSASESQECKNFFAAEEIQGTRRKLRRQLREAG